MASSKAANAAAYTLLGTAIFSLIGGAVFLGAAIATVPVYLIWNHALVDAIPGIHPIGWWTAFGVAWFMRMFGHTGTSSTTCKCECVKKPETYIDTSVS